MRTLFFNDRLQLFIQPKNDFPGRALIHKEAHQMYRVFTTPVLFITAAVSESKSKCFVGKLFLFYKISSELQIAFFQRTLGVRVFSISIQNSNGSSCTKYYLYVYFVFNQTIFYTKLLHFKSDFKFFQIIIFVHGIAPI